MTEPTHGYAGICPDCDALCAARVDNDDRKHVKEAVAEFLDCGLNIERLPIEEIRKRFRSCLCNAEPKEAE